MKSTNNSTAAFSRPVDEMMTPDALVEKILMAGGRGMRSNLEKQFSSGKSRGDAYDARLGAAA